jgi:hypothetical protein
MTLDVYSHVSLDGRVRLQLEPCWCRLGVVFV